MNPITKQFLSAFLVLSCAATILAAASAPMTNVSSAHQLRFAFSGESQSTAAKKPVWTDPDQVLPSLRYDQLPLAEVAQHLRDLFKYQFDVVMPSGIKVVNPEGNPEVADVQSIPITLSLQNVKASEVFNAMNLLFAANEDLVRWELLINGTRPTAVLQLASPEERKPTRTVAEPTKLMAFFVGDIVEEGRPGKMSWSGFSKMIQEISMQTFKGSGPKIATHPDASLVVVSGTSEQLDFIGNMLAALKEKANHDSGSKAQSASAKPALQPAEPPK